MTHGNTRSADQLVLGIDGGGSKTLAWLAACGTQDGLRPLGQGQAGASNPRVVGVERCGQQIIRATRAAFDAAGICAGPVAAAGIALAGVGNESLRRAVLAWCVNQRLAVGIEVVHDALAVLYAGSTHGVGIALIAGTGSFVFGRTTSNRTARAGGWGYLFGDEGSGYWLGLQALRAITHAADGRVAETMLTTAVLNASDVATPADLVPAICQATPDRRRIAALAPTVLTCAVQNDPVACRIVDDAADQLAQQVVAVARRLEMAPNSFLLNMAGGLLANSSTLAHAVTTSLQRCQYAPREVRVIAQPVAGAVRIARRLRPTRPQRS